LVTTWACHDVVSAWVGALPGRQAENGRMRPCSMA
jgi:hypothetical protein